MVKFGGFNPEKDIPSLAGKVILITGGNDGIGKQTALDLAKHEPAAIWIAARNAKTGNAVVEEITKLAPGVSARFLELDLSSLASVKAAAKTFRASASRLDLLICNAGLMAGGLVTSKDGFELRMAVNHLGHALLMNLLAPIMVQTTIDYPGAQPRIVSLSSAGHRFVPKEGIDFDQLREAAPSRLPVIMYCEAKLAQVLYTRTFAKRYPQIVSVSVNPGDIRTNLYTGSKGPWFFEIIKTVVLPFMASTVQDGAKNSLWAATSNRVVSGDYYDPVGVADTASPLSKDEKLIKRMEEWTEEALKGQYP